MHAIVPQVVLRAIMIIQPCQVGCEVSVPLLQPQAVVALALFLLLLQLSLLWVFDAERVQKLLQVQRNGVRGRGGLNHLIYRAHAD